MKLYFLSLASGSSGNCYYLGTTGYGILIDAGVGVRTVKKVLKEKQLDFSQIIAVLITHDHADHIKAAGSFGEKYNIPVYATDAVHKGIDKSRFIDETLAGDVRRIIEKETTFAIHDFLITPFEVPHDSADNVGYLIRFGNRTFTFATDVGHITDTVSAYVTQANHLVIEANYDEEMLRTGAYPQFLKDRVASPTGHLSNRETAEFLATHYHPGLKDIWLCHLSRDNNHPELAYKTIDIRLFSEGIRVGKDVTLTTLKRSTPSDLYEFDC
ncbi:MAG: MBL fold metallo-hydrolase [Tannerellaceae bacterium]|jgi:phosphoribosyl 1,2-cyclic phosphodiesterase|nr:MBL fold metallo-hydrolase [Tannerellaceae bacterium]